MAYQLVDHLGRPIKTSALVQRVAEPGLTTIRDAWAHSVASGMTPSRLASVLMSAAEGNIHDYLILAEEMEERDQHYASVLGIRKRAISGIEAIIEEASDSPLDKKIADDLRENIAEHDGFSDLVEDMLDALGKGFSQVELDWGRSKKRWWIEEFVRRDPRFFTFDRDTGREVRLPSEGEQVLVACEGGDIAQGVVAMSLYSGNAPSADGSVPMINLAGGKMIINGTLEVTVDVIAAGVSLVHHTHKGVAAGTSNTGEPNA